MVKKYFKEHLIEKGLLSASAVSFLTILSLVAFLIVEAIPVFREVGFFSFIFGMNWIPEDNSFGIFPMLIGSIYVTAIALVIAAPLSISCAIFLEEIAPANLRKLFKPVIQTLAGIPSVIYGFFGVMLLVPFVRQNFGGNGFSIISASIVLALMILPTIISVGQDAIRSVPKMYREASFGLGSTRWDVIRNIILPIALPGLVSAIILGMARAIGETLAVMMLAGNVSQIQTSVFDPVRTLTANIALEMGYATGIHYNALFATAVILFIATLALMLISNYIQRRFTLKG